MTLGNMNVGWNSLTTETPIQIKWFYRIIMLISGLWMLVIEPNFTGIIPEHVLHVTDKLVASFSTSIYFICQFFGWKQPSTDS